MSFHANQYVCEHLHVEKIPTIQSVIAVLQEVARWLAGFVKLHK